MTYKQQLILLVELYKSSSPIESAIAEYILDDLKYDKIIEVFFDVFGSEPLNEEDLNDLFKMDVVTLQENYPSLIESKNDATWIQGLQKKTEQTILDIRNRLEIEYC